MPSNQGTNPVFEAEGRKEDKVKEGVRLEPWRRLDISGQSVHEPPKNVMNADGVLRVALDDNKGRGG